MKLAFLAFALAFASACAVQAPADAITHVESGWLVAECPGAPDACVRSAEQHCDGRAYLLATRDGEPPMLIHSPAGAAYARQVAGSGRLRARCVDRLFEQGSGERSATPTQATTFCCLD